MDPGPTGRAAFVPGAGGLASAAATLFTEAAAGPDEAAAMPMGRDGGRRGMPGVKSLPASARASSVTGSKDLVAGRYTPLIQGYLT